MFLRKPAIKYFALLLLIVASHSLYAENGYDLWLRYKPTANTRLAGYRQQLNSVYLAGNSSTIAVIKEELNLALTGILQVKPVFSSQLNKDGTLLIGTPAASGLIKELNLQKEFSGIGDEGYIIISKKINNKNTTLISANTDKGLLYGVFAFLRLLQTEQPVQNLNIVSAPALRLRLLNHWDNLTRFVERGYAGISIWNWHTLPGYLDKRYKDYARACASIGINGAALTNVNANATVLTAPYLRKVAALANVFRPYGIKVYLTARFSAPIEIGGLKTADPLDKDVQQWWKNKINEIYALIPDFGGFVVKANSEGQPGPQAYGRNHADGANLLADALQPHNGIVMWRAFVYSNEVPDDRHKQAYNEFTPLDGKFRKNVMVQVKNGPIDFQPREIFHPLFGAMPKTPLMMEFQLTQEYLGFATHLVYLAPLFKECLESDTYYKGKGNTVAKVIEGKLDDHELSGMTGVANIGNDINWTGHPFAQSNWYALGRLAWNPELSAEQIADEWIRMSFTNDPSFVAPVKKMMMSSRETTVNYMTPLGLHHIMGYGHHYGPAPWVNNAARPDWNCTYYHRADSAGIGFDRTASGSNALAQYAPEVQMQYANINTCPPAYLLWFHHASWDFKLQNGETLWNELCRHYYAGVDSVRQMQKTWNNLQMKVDQERFNQVRMLLQIQEEEAVWWRNACLLYFQTFSKRAIPAGLEKPSETLEYYKQLKFPFAPGN